MAALSEASHSHHHSPALVEHPYTTTAGLICAFQSSLQQPHHQPKHNPADLVIQQSQLPVSLETNYHRQTIRIPKAQHGEVVSNSPPTFFVSCCLLRPLVMARPLSPRFKNSYA